MAQNNRIHEMREEFNELRQAIADDIDAQFKAGQLRLREGVSKDLDDRFASSERRLTHVIVQQLETAQQHLEGRLQVHLKDLSGTLDQIERDLGGVNKKMDATLSIHGKVLAHRNQRLVTREHSRRASRAARSLRRTLGRRR